MKVAIGIPTYNRRHLVDLHAQSLCSSHLPSGTALIVIDDASTDYDVAYLKSIYPAFTDIRRRSEKSGGASFVLRELMVQLLATDADAMLLLDSDLIVATDFIQDGLKQLAESDGLLSLFNTPNHPAIGARGSLLRKSHIGSAASLWTRAIAAEVVDGVPPGPEWDWRFSAFLTKAGHEICAVRRSLVQHAGFSEGQNSNFMSGDFGTGFGDADAANAYRLIELLMADSQTKFRHVRTETDALRKQADAFSSQTATLKNQTDTLQTNAGALQERTNTLRDRADSLQQQAEMLQSRAETLQDRSDALQSQTDALRAQFDITRGQTDTLLRRVKRVERILGLTLLARISKFIRKLLG